MNKTMKKLMIYIPLTLVLVFGILMIDKTVLADTTTEIVWTSENVVEGKIKSIGYPTSVVIKGTAATASKVVYSFDQVDYENAKILSNGQWDEPTEFSLSIPLEGSANDNGKSVYVYALSNSAILEEVVLTIEQPSVSINNNKTVYIYKDTTEVKIPVSIQNYESECTYVLKNNSIASQTIQVNDNDIKGVKDADGKVAITLPINDGNRKSAEYYVYVVDKTEKVVCSKKFNVVYENPTLEWNDYYRDDKIVRSIGYLQENYRGTETVKVKVNDRPEGTKIAYSIDDEFIGKTEEEIVDLLGNGTIVSDEYDLKVNINKYTVEGSKVYIYIYTNKDGVKKIYDKKRILICREYLDIDYSDMSIKDNNETTSEVLVKTGQDSVAPIFSMKGFNTEYSIPFYDGRIDMPYYLVIESLDGDFIYKKEYLSSEWRKTRDGNYEYFIELSICGMNDIPSEGIEFVAYVERWVRNGPYIELGKEVRFTVKKETPTMKLKDINVGNNNEIEFPLYNDLTAELTGVIDNDIVSMTTIEFASDEELKEWAKDNSTKEYNISGGTKQVSIEKEDFPCIYPGSGSDTVSHFYLVRKKGQDDMEVFPIGDYKIVYKNIENHWGNYWGPMNSAETIYSISNVDFYFVDTTEESGVKKGDAVIRGYYYNGLGNSLDEIIWTDDATKVDTAAHLQAWAEDTETVGLPSTINAQQYNQGYYNYYTCEINDIEFNDTITSKKVYLYVRRNAGNGTIQVIPLGELTIKEAHEPELTISSIEESTGEITIKGEAFDDNTGIREVVVEYVGKEEGYRWGHHYEEYNYKTETMVSVNEKRPGDNIEVNYKLNYKVTEENQKTVKITVKNWNGKEKVYSDILINKPSVQVTPKKELETLGKENYYIVATNNAEFDIAVNKDSKSVAEMISEAQSLKSLVVKVNGVEILNKTYTDEATDTQTINIANENVQPDANNEYKVNVRVTNVVAGGLSNEAEYAFVMKVDDIKPAFDSIKVNGEEDSLQTKKYTTITNHKVDVELNVKDEGESGIKNIKYYWLSGDGAKSSEVVTDVTGYPGTANTTATINKSFRGYLYANIEDTVGNKLDKYVSTGGIIIDLPENHNSENHINLTLADTASKDKKGNPLYNRATTITIEASDIYSGIKNVSWEISAPNDKSANKSGRLNIDLNGNFSDDDGWRKVSTDSNIVTAVNKQITVNGNSDDMVLTVRMTDNAGNTSEKVVNFSIDQVKPVISVSYNTQTGDSDFNNYFSDTRTATIVVKERNFNTDSANSMITNTLGNKGTISAWKENRDAQNPDNSTYTATVTFEKDDRYALSFQCSDRAGNTSDVVTTPEFVIDKVNPELTVTFDNANGKNGYYANARTATITIKEVNFEAGRVGISGVNGQDYTLSSWTRKDNSYSAVITFAKDGVFAFNVTVKDKAGNTGNSVSVPTFTIDLINPEVEIEGVENKSANKGTVAPKITFSDKNIDKDSIVVELIGANNGKMDITGWYTVSEDGLTVTFKNIESIKENDDLYTLRVSAKDLAGNKTEEEILFTVNRFGSIYILGDNLKKVNDKYVKTAKGIEITEINVDKINGKSVVITLTVNGVPQTLTEGVDYKIVAEEKDAEWKQYKYVFEDSLFEKDGSYILAITSEDEAGNKNNNSNDEKEAEIKFGVDATAPIVSAVNFEANHYYDENGMEFVVSVKDNMVLDSVNVYVNGQSVSVVENDEMYSFYVEESARRQEIKIVARDAAGNEAIENYEGILVAGNFFIRLLHNRLAIAAIAGSSLLVLAGGIFVVVRKIAR